MNCNATTLTESRLRALIGELRTAGVEQPREILIASAVDVVERSLRAWRMRGDGSAAVLARMIQQGGPSSHDVRARLSERERVIGQLDDWTRGYPEYAGRWREYDRRAGVA